MPTFYTVDRKGTLREGLQIFTKDITDITPAVLGDHVRHLYPDGLSQHGERYIAGAPTNPADALSGFLEDYFENVRRAWFPDKPCRYVSMFAWATVAEAQAFAASRYAGQSSAAAAPRVFELESPSFFRADMRLMRDGPSSLVRSYLAHLYWQGLPNPDGISPEWELIVPLPAVVGRQVA